MHRRFVAAVAVAVAAVAAVAALLTVAAPAIAQVTSHEDRFSVGLGTGILGAGIDGSYVVSDRLSVRANVNYGRYELPGWLALTSEIAGIPYDYDLRLLTVGALADYHVLGSARDGNSLTLTGGLYFNGNRFGLVTTPLFNLMIGGTTYTPAQIGTLTTDLDFDRTIAPYIGVGAQTNFFSDLPVSGFIRFGLLFQGPASATMSASAGGVSGPDLAAEETDLQGSLGFLEILPIVSLGATFRF